MKTVPDRRIRDRRTEPAAAQNIASVERSIVAEDAAPFAGPTRASPLYRRLMKSTYKSQNGHF